jgi:hypothetical protein
MRLAEKLDWKGLSTTNITLNDFVLATYVSHLATGSAVTRAGVLLMLHPFHLLEMDSSRGWDTEQYDIPAVCG